MSNPVAMDDLETEKEPKGEPVQETMSDLTLNIKNDPEEENMPHFTLDMDDSFLVDESFLIAGNFPDTSDVRPEIWNENIHGSRVEEDCFVFVKEELDIDHGEFAEEMDCTEEIMLPPSHGTDPSSDVLGFSVRKRAAQEENRSKNRNYFEADPEETSETTIGSSELVETL